MRSPRAPADWASPSYRLKISGAVDTPLSLSLEQIKFIAADGKYSANLTLEDVTGQGMLIAYAFEDKPLPKVHGYPLRVVAKDQQGNRWVKWLGEIVVQ